MNDRWETVTSSKIIIRDSHTVGRRSGWLVVH